MDSLKWESEVLNDVLESIIAFDLGHQIQESMPVSVEVPPSLNSQIHCSCFNVVDQRLLLRSYSERRGIY